MKTAIAMLGCAVIFAPAIVAAADMPKRPATELRAEQGWLSDEEAVARGVSPNTKSPGMGGAPTFSTGLKPLATKAD